MIYYEVSIQPSHSTDGEYQVVCTEKDYRELQYILDDIRSNVDELYILGEDDLPEHISDIRGRIHDEPAIVYAYVRDDYIGYGGIDAAEITISILRQLTGMTQRAFGEYLNIPVRTIENWEAEQRTPPDYVVELIREKLTNDGII